MSVVVSVDNYDACDLVAGISHHIVKTKPGKIPAICKYQYLHPIALTQPARLPVV